MVSAIKTLESPLKGNRQKKCCRISFLFLIFIFIQPQWLPAQADCILQPPVLNIDFGSSKRPVELNLSSLENYNRIYEDCPQDGNYAVVSSTSDCFGGHWITVNQDHTPGDIEGKMLLVNAAYRPGLFFVTALKGLLPNTTYEFAAWLLNVCWAGNNCTPIRPNIRFIIETPSGKELAKFSTGELPPPASASWLQYSARFTTPGEVGALLLKIETKADGGCGNDFAMDDITIRECLLPKPILKEKPKTEPKPEVKQPLPVNKPVVKERAPAPKPVKKDIPVLIKLPVKDTIVINRPVTKARPSFIPVPAPILSRDNPVIKKIETPTAELVIDLYDNGEIDGDTVSIYHNNALLVSHAALSAKPISFHLIVDAAHPHHELVMVANNLGSIPPNTSLMIITARNRRYEVFISSSEQKNAKVVIDLKE